MWHEVIFLKKLELFSIAKGDVVDYLNFKNYFFNGKGNVT
jgi:hypothetical protein